MESFITSLIAITLAEIGDKTQFLALLLATRFKRPLPVIAGIFLAVVVNHAIAGGAGALIGQYLKPQTLRYILGISFIATAIWMLKADKEEEPGSLKKSRGAFTTSFIAFLIAEIGDKTQIATAQLAAKFHDLPMVICGTVVGMMLADLPVIFMGNRISAKLPMQRIRVVTAVIFAVLGVLALLGIG